MATGRIGVTPVLRTRWSDQPTAGTTSLSGLDDNSVALVYDAGYEAVYRNGVLLSRGNDYTATNGTTITLIDATLAGDIIEVFANDLVPLTDAISKGQYNAKGALLSASAVSTPGVLTVGSNDQVLTADSTTSTGLKWATPAAGGGMTLLSTTTLTGSEVSITSIPSTYKNLQLVIRSFRPVIDGFGAALRVNSNTGSVYFSQLSNVAAGTVVGDLAFPISSNNQDAGAASTSLIAVDLFDYANTSTWKIATTMSTINNAATPTVAEPRLLYGMIFLTNAISSIQIRCQNGDMTSGTALLYGVS